MTPSEELKRCALCQIAKRNFPDVNQAIIDAAVLGACYAESRKPIGNVLCPICREMYVKGLIEFGGIETKA